MIRRKKLEATADRLQMSNLINIESLNDFVSLDGLNGYEGRVKFILKLVLSKREYLIFKFLCNEVFVNTFIKRYGGRIRVEMIPIVSNPSSHIIEIDGRTFYLVGSDIEFHNQFKELIRESKIRSLFE